MSLVSHPFLVSLRGVTRRLGMNRALSKLFNWTDVSLLIAVRGTAA